MRMQMRKRAVFKWGTQSLFFFFFGGLVGGRVGSSLQHFHGDFMLIEMRQRKSSSFPRAAKSHSFATHTLA